MSISYQSNPFFGTAIFAARAGILFVLLGRGSAGFLRPVSLLLSNGSVGFCMPQA